MQQMTTKKMIGSYFIDAAAAAGFEKKNSRNHEREYGCHKATTS